jgi:fumarylpyruvate hydrolase
LILFSLIVDYSGPIGSIIPKSEMKGDITSKELKLLVNGQLRQQGFIHQMIWSISDIISYLSQQVELEEGDLIFTGTPAGVGSITRSDVLEASCDDLPTCRVTIK